MKKYFTIENTKIKMHKFRFPRIHDVRKISYVPASFFIKLNLVLLLICPKINVS